MKNFVCIFALIVVSLFATVSVKAIEGCGGNYYIVSDTYDIGGTVYGYSATELDYCAGLYNDPVVSGIFLENSSLLGSAYSEGYANQDPAIVSFGYSSPVAGQTYTNFGDHYIIAYYQVYVPYWNDWFWCDPWQIGFMEIGGGYEGPGYYGWGYAYYWQSQYIYVGSTSDSIVYCGQTQCQTGQQFSPTGVSCSFQPPSGVCGEPEPPKPKVRIQSVGFKDDYQIRRLANPAEFVDFNDTTPTWIKGRGDIDKYPVAYKRGSSVKIFGTFTVENAVPNYPNVTIQMKVGDTLFATISNVNVQTNGEISFNNLTLVAPLTDSTFTRMKEYEFKWRMIDSTGQETDIGESKHQIHWLYEDFVGDNNSIGITGIKEPNFKSNPHSLNTDTHWGLFDEALKHSTGAINENSNDMNVIAKKITEHIKSKIYYKPSQAPFTDNPLKAFIESNQKQCSDNAAILQALLRSIGITGGRQEFYIGGNPANGNHHYYADPNSPPPTNFPDDYVTSQYGRNFAEDGGGVNPRFSFHSTIVLNGKSYDPSYGVEENEVKFIEVVSDTGQCIKGEGANVFKLIRLDNARNYPLSSPNFGYKCGTYTPPFPRSSSFISQSLPSDLQVGQTYSVAITLQNNGINTWRASEGYQLGSQSPEDNFIWGVNRINLPNDIAPGQQVTINFNVTAPSMPGTYNFQWRMIQNGVEWFGDATESMPIEVIGQTQCSSGDQQACYWQGGYWNSNTCTCEGIY